MYRSSALLLLASAVAAQQITEAPKIRQATIATDDPIHSTCDNLDSRWSMCMLDDQGFMTVDDDKISAALNCICCSGSSSLYEYYSSCSDALQMEGYSSYYSWCSVSADCEAFAATGIIDETSATETLTTETQRTSEPIPENTSTSTSDEADTSATGSDDSSGTDEPDAAISMQAGHHAALAGFAALALWV